MKVELKLGRLSTLGDKLLFGGLSAMAVNLTILIINFVGIFFQKDYRDN